MREIREIAEWFAREQPHVPVLSDSLPSPRFRAGGRDLVSFSSNNYLALATSERLIASARRGLERYGVANCESRLLGGDLDVYRLLEARLAALKRKEAAVLFATGYLTNLGALAALVKSSQLARLYGFRPSRCYTYAYFSDELNHVSINEGIRLSGAERITYAHLDLDDLEAKLKRAVDRERLIVTDGVFSQDGDIAPLPELLALAERYDAMVYVDDAHATGVLGPSGGGTAEHFGCDSPRLIQMGTLSKAFGALGGFVATESHIAEALRFTSPAYGFTSTVPPDQAFAVLEALEVARDEPERRRQLWRNQAAFVERMQHRGYQLVSTQTPIVPVLVGDERACDRLAARLREEGLYVDAVKFPAVPLGQSRLRVILNAHHTAAQIDALVELLGCAADATVPRHFTRSPPPQWPPPEPPPEAAPHEAPGLGSALQREIFDALHDILRAEFQRAEPLTLSAPLRGEQLDSMDLMVVAVRLEERFGVSLLESPDRNVETVLELILLVEARILEPRASP